MMHTYFYKIVPISLKFRIAIIVCVIMFCLSGLCHVQKVSKIAIIGAGIGGSACAHFINNDFGDNVAIDIYEAKEVGGRVATVDYFGSTFETGGCVIHERNKYMDNFRNQFHLEKRIDEQETTGIYDGNEFNFVTSKYRYYTFIKMLFHYGYLSVHRLHSFIANMLDKFDKIYQIQNEGRAFETVGDLFQAASTEFLQYFEINAAEGFKQYANVNDEVMNELIQGSLRVNYGQNLDVHLFVGAVSVAGMFGPIWSVKGGNKRIPQLLIKNSRAKFYKRKVTAVVYHPETGMYFLDVDGENNNVQDTEYDYVVIAAPLTTDTENVNFVNIEKPNVPGRYHRTVATIMAGEINGSMFHVENSQCPKMIICTNESSSICSLSQIKGVDGQRVKGQKKVWKIFSPKALQKDEFKMIFTNYNEPQVFDWLAYPQYKNSTVQARSFVLHKNLYHINAIEWAASAMEMSVIAAKNVALLIKNEIMKINGFHKNNGFNRIEL